MSDFRILEWDSRFFGFTVGQIASPALDAAGLERALAELRELKARLVYWPADAAAPAHGAAAERLGGRLVDQKTTFAIEVARLKLPPRGDERSGNRAGNLVEKFGRETPNAALIELAIQSGRYSRFAVDPNVPPGKFAEMYTIWITRAVAGEIADEVLVIRGDGGREIGMVVLVKRDGSSNIGLIAVDAAHRGKRYGEALVRAAQQWAVDNGCTMARVVTQGANVPACRLNLKCGYSIEKMQPYYHFWL